MTKSETVRTSKRPPKGDGAPEASSPSAPERQRIAKAMARAGLCSRRDAEQWIVEGRVSVNGEILTSPARDVSPSDDVLVDGEPMPQAERTRLFLFHKPRGLVTSDHDPEGRETVADFLREHWPEGPRVVTIGRLDINTEGLLLLTNDGGLARVLELPQTGWVRRYRVRAKGETDQAKLDALSRGVTVDGVDYAGIEAVLDRVQGANCWLTMGLREGKNREIKRVLESLGLEVNRLIRLSFGPFQLLELPEGAVEEVRPRVLKDQLGEKLAAQAGALFDDAVAPVVADAAASKPSSGTRSGREKPADRAPRTRQGGDTRPTRDTLTAKRFVRRGDAPSAEQEPVRERPQAGARKHVSTLRSDRDTSTRSGPRMRIERAATRDKNDRAVAVERIVRATPARGSQRGKTLSPSAEAKRYRTDRSGGAGARGGNGEGREREERGQSRAGFAGGRRESRPPTGAQRPEAAREDRRDTRAVASGRRERGEVTATRETERARASERNTKSSAPRAAYADRPSRSGRVDGDRRTGGQGSGAGRDRSADRDRGLSRDRGVEKERGAGKDRSASSRGAKQGSPVFKERSSEGQASKGRSSKPYAAKSPARDGRSGSRDEQRGGGQARGGKTGGGKAGDGRAGGGKAVGGKAARSRAGSAPQRPGGGAGGRPRSGHPGKGKR